MDNKQIYQKTLGFSWRRLLWDVISVILLIALSAIGFLVAEKASNQGLIGLGIGFILGLIALAIISRYIAYSYKAGQIAMMTRALTENQLPDDVIAEGKSIVKERFSTVAAYFAITGVIKGIFNEIGRGITAVGEAVGGDTGGAVGSTVSSVIQTVVAYLCDCCLGWVFYRKDVKAGKATCEGAVIFFKHGKTLAKNLGRVFGMGALSFLTIAGVFTGIFYLIFRAFPDAFSHLSAEVLEAGARAGVNLPAFVSDPNILTLICAAIIGAIFWGILHSAFVRPFVLVGVLRNFLKSGIDDMPTEASFKELDAKSAKFQKLHSEL